MSSSWAAQLQQHYLLAAICAEKVATYHVEDALSIDPASRSVRFRPAGIHHSEEIARDWLAPSGPVRVGVTAGASTPNNKIGEAVARILATRGVEAELP